MFLKTVLATVIIFVLNLVSFLIRVKAITITFDTFSKSEGIWEYSYIVSDYIFNTGYGFTLYFDYGLYENIIPIAQGDDWEVFSWDPQIIMGFKELGVYETSAMIDHASLEDPFTVKFNWLGMGKPGFQFFEVYDSSTWEIIDSGTTLHESIQQVITIVVNYQEGCIHSVKIFDHDLKELTDLKTGLHFALFNILPSRHACKSFDIMQYFDDRDEKISINYDPSLLTNSLLKIHSSYWFFNKTCGDNYEIMNDQIYRLYKRSETLSNN